jgi:cell division protein FtsI/penicillin-binding protein 2
MVRQILRRFQEFRRHALVLGLGFFPLVAAGLTMDRGTAQAAPPHSAVEMRATPGPSARPSSVVLDGPRLGAFLDRDAGKVQPPAVPPATVATVSSRSLRSLGQGLGALLAAGAATEPQLADGQRYRVSLEQGTQAELTLDPRLQRLADRVLASHRLPYAAAVLMSVSDGNVLAMAGRSEAEPAKTAVDLCLAAWAPAASVFKIVTASALLSSGVQSDARVCYHDGVHSVEASNLAYHRRDHTCNSLAFGIAKSQNAILARLANDYLDPETLERTARALGFGAALPTDVPVAASQLSVPRDPLGFARVAAGFWQTTLSPLHGAYLAATIARGGVTPPVHLVQRVMDKNGAAVAGATPAPSQRVLDEQTARAVGEMMIGTTRFGTARHAFNDRRGRPYLRGVAVAGKTGTLNRKEPYLGYSWFVGYAPARDPKVAFAVLVGNDEEWHLRAAQVARELLEGYFHRHAPSGHTAIASR